VSANRASAHHKNFSNFINCQKFLPRINADARGLAYRQLQVRSQSKSTQPIKTYIKILERFLLMGQIRLYPR
jgi:hypothetical protein